MCKMRFLLVILATSAYYTKFSTAGDLDWYRTAVLYQIYPRSFKDNNNDGIGDLQGIIEKLDLFIDAGVTCFWLSPIFKSPQVDQGYDISDYYEIDESYGTEEDLRELLDKAHAAGIKVLMDFVPNHTSDEHDWFKKSVAREEGYEDFYVWVNATVDTNGSKTPPNNWLNLFEGGAWDWSDDRQQYFLHQFTAHQPDLNYRSENMLKALEDVMTYWLDLGVDGFRVDAVPYLLEDEALRDAPLVCSDVTYDCLDHIYTKDLPGTFDAIYRWRDFVDNYTRVKGGDARIIITEAYTDFNKTLFYYANEDGSRLGAHFTFNFDFISYLREDSKPADLQDIIYRWQTSLNESYPLNWVLGNHDNHRVATRLGNPDAYNMLTCFLPGVPVTYQGEEIGMENGEVSCAQGKDPVAIGNCTTYPQRSRDFERTPFQWDNRTNAGFNEGADPWLPVSKKYLTNNLAAQNITGIGSHYNAYKSYTKFHEKLANISSSLTVAGNKTHGIIFMDTQNNENVFVMVRKRTSTCPEMHTYAYIFNMNKKENVTVEIPIPDVNRVRVEAVNSRASYEVNTILLRGDGINLEPGESIILRAECN